MAPRAERSHDPELRDFPGYDLPGYGHAGTYGQGSEYQAGDHHTAATPDIAPDPHQVVRGSYGRRARVAPEDLDASWHDNPAARSGSWGEQHAEPAAGRRKRTLEPTASPTGPTETTGPAGADTPSAPTPPAASGGRRKRTDVADHDRLVLDQVLLDLPSVPPRYSWSGENVTTGSWRRTGDPALSAAEPAGFAIPHVVPDPSGAREPPPAIRRDEPGWGPEWGLGPADQANDLWSSDSHVRTTPGSHRAPDPPLSYEVRPEDALLQDILPDSGEDTTTGFHAVSDYAEPSHAPQTSSYGSGTTDARGYEHFAYEPVQEFGPPRSSSYPPSHADASGQHLATDDLTARDLDRSGSPGQRLSLTDAESMIMLPPVTLGPDPSGDESHLVHSGLDDRPSERQRRRSLEEPLEDRPSQRQGRHSLEDPWEDRPSQRQRRRTPDDLLEGRPSQRQRRKGHPQARYARAARASAPGTAGPSEPADPFAEQYRRQYARGQPDPHHASPRGTTARSGDARGTEAAHARRTDQAPDPMRLRHGRDADPERPQPARLHAAHATTSELGRSGGRISLSDLTQPEAVPPAVAALHGAHGPMRSDKGARRAARRGGRGARAGHRVRRTRQPGLTSPLAVAAAILGALCFAYIDLQVSERLGVIFAGGFVLTSLAVAVTIRRSDVFTAGVLPPLAGLATFAVIGILAPDRLAPTSEPVVAVLAGLASESWTLAAGSAAALTTVATRVILVRRREGDPDAQFADPDAARAAVRRSDSHLRF